MTRWVIGLLLLTVAVSQGIIYYQQRMITAHLQDQLQRIDRTPNGNCVHRDADHNLMDAGAACYPQDGVFPLPPTEQWRPGTKFVYDSTENKWVLKDGSCEVKDLNCMD